LEFVTSWLIVAGDFAPLGGMDAANHALAAYLARERDVHLVTHHVSADLEALPRITVHEVPRPLGRHALGAPLLARAGRRVRRRLGQPTCALVNGGNCSIAGAMTWVHYVHAAYAPDPRPSLFSRTNNAMTRRRDLAGERAALAEAPLVICNSRRTRDDVVHHHRLAPSQTRVIIYYGCDPARLAAVTADERASARARFGWPVERPVIAFVGALGDRRKAFDTVFAAWMRLCADPSWDADLVVVGTGGERRAWERRAAGAGCGGRMRFLGFRRDVPDILAAADALVHPARYEAYGLSVREALCRGIPAIVTRSAGVAEEYPPALTDLLLESPDDAVELAGRLQHWRRHRAALSEVVRPVADALRRRTWDHMAADIVAAVEEHAATTLERQRR
jgi:glycosyltransferase involved in cell wall biosynthesis